MNNVIMYKSTIYIGNNVKSTAGLQKIMLTRYLLQAKLEFQNVILFLALFVTYFKIYFLNE